MCFISTSDIDTYNLLKSLGYEEIESSSPHDSLHTFINKKPNQSFTEKATFDSHKVAFHNKLMV